MPEAGKADELALMGDGGDCAGERMLGDAGAQNVKRAPESNGLCGEIARYQAVSNLVQMCP